MVVPISKDLYLQCTLKILVALFPDGKNIFYMQGSMGLAPCIGLGIARYCKRDVVVLSGDGALLMHLGIIHTIQDENLSNLHVYVLDNGCHESVGAYRCSDLGVQDIYPGIDKIYKISRDGKCARVGIDCITNASNIKKILDD